MVVQRKYALEESITGKDITRSLPWRASIRRGMKIDMSMVFLGTFIISGSCPRCKAVVDVPEDVKVEW